MSTVQEARGLRIPEVLYGKDTIFRTVHRRFGSVKLGACLVVIEPMFPGCCRAYLGQIGRLGVNFGPAGGIEAGLAELTRDELGRCRIFYLRNGRAFAINWGSSA